MDSQTVRIGLTCDDAGAAAPASDARLGVPTRLLLCVIRGYQAVRRGRPSPCRYVPSCSQYAIEALHRHGAGRGASLTLRRLCRCHPWGGYGVDPVPDLPGSPGARNPS